MKGNCPEISVSSDRDHNQSLSDTAAIPSYLLVARTDVGGVLGGGSGAGEEVGTG